MSKLNKKQQKIYDWLISKPGYLKKSANSLFGLHWSTINGSQHDYFEALKQARIDYPNKETRNTNTSKVYNLNLSKNVKLKSIKSKLDNNYSHVKIAVSKFNPDNVLAVADMHEPFCKDGYLEHCIKIRDKYNCGTIVLIGDEVDLCGVGQWEKDPDGFSAGTEAFEAQRKMELWYKAFPEAKVCIGNHTARPFRMARANGIPKKFIKSYEDAWNAPKGWEWAENWEINGVLYTHGTGMSGSGAALKIASMHRQNTVIGHIHSQAGIQYSASKIDLIWGMQLGGALDDTSYAAYYAKDQLKKSIIGCGVIIDGKLPIYEPMNL